MPARSKLRFAAVAAAAMMLAFVANASARNFSTSEREFWILFRPLRFEAAGNTISCPITLLGNFVGRTIPKIVGSQVGVIDDIDPHTVAGPPCTGGTLTVLTETLPWPVNYQGFSGTLPNITAIRTSLIRVSFRIRTSGGIGCLAGTTTRTPAFGEFLLTSGRVTGYRADETSRIPLSGGFICSIGGEARFAGTGTVMNLAQTGSITVTLI